MKEALSHNERQLNDQERKPQTKEEFWAIQRAHFEQSGLSRKAFCRQEGLSYDQFQYWLHKESSLDRPGFVAVVPKSSLNRASPEVAGTLVLAGDRQLHVHDAQILYQILLQVI